MTKYDHLPQATDLITKSELIARRQETSRLKGRNQLIRKATSLLVGGAVALGVGNYIADKSDTQNSVVQNNIAPAMQGVQRNIQEHEHGSVSGNITPQHMQERVDALGINETVHGSLPPLEAPGPNPLPTDPTTHVG